MGHYDVIVIGGGGSGLTAALYTARGNLKTALFEKVSAGGQISTTDLVENYPGFPEGISGMDIAMKMEEQAKKYGTEFIYREVSRVMKTAQGFSVEADGETFVAKAVIIASGANPRKLNASGEDQFVGRGVSYCATCDGAFFKGKQIAVVGGGDSAIQEALFLTKFAKTVTVIHRRDELRASKILQDRARAHRQISFLWNAVVVGVEGGAKVERAIVEDVKTKQKRAVSFDGIFVFVGHDPVSQFVKGFVACDEHGYVVCNGSFETSVPGVFACGEVRQGATRQLVSACGEGCSAALAAQAYLDNL